MKVKCPKCGNACDPEEDGEYCTDCGAFLEIYDLEEVKD